MARMSIDMFTEPAQDRAADSGRELATVTPDPGLLGTLRWVLTHMSTRAITDTPTCCASASTARQASRPLAGRGGRVAWPFRH